MTLCNALGASLGGFFGSPPGWYLYLKLVRLLNRADFDHSSYLYSSRALSPLVASLCQGMLPWATETFDSEVADVGLRPGEVILSAWNRRGDQSLEGKVYQSRSLQDRKHLT